MEIESYINFSFIENGERVRKSYFLEFENGYYRFKSIKYKLKFGINLIDIVLYLRVKY